MLVSLSIPDMCGLKLFMLGSHQEATRCLGRNRDFIKM